MNKHLSVVIALLALPLAVLAGNDFTSETDLVEANDSSKVVDIDEVLIVAQPKENTRLRLQPISSNLYGAADMNRLHIEDLRQLASYVPSFAMPQYGSRLTSSMYIRGLGSRISNSAIGVYYDNVPLISPGMFNSHFHMVDRVDVLRGPQGTLYGANSEGGIVRIYSKNPMNYQGTDVSLGVGNGFQRHAELSHYQRVSDRFAFSVAGFYRGQNGFFQNEYLDEKNDKTNEAGGKVRLVWKPTDRLTIDLTSDYQFTNQNAFPYGVYDATDNSVALPSTNMMNGYKRNMVNTGLNISYQLDSMLLTSTTSYQFLRDCMDMDVDYTSKDQLTLQQRQKMQAVTEEITLRSDNNGAFWQHVTGLFGSRQWLRTDATVDFGRAILDPIGQGIEQAMKAAMKAGIKASTKQQMLDKGMPEAVAEANAEKAAQSAVDAAGVVMNAEVMSVPCLFRQPVTNLAAYHETNLNLTNRLKATLGLRFDYTKAELEYDALGYMSITGGTAKKLATYTLTSHIANNHSTTFTQLLPKVGLTWQLDNDGNNIYAIVSKGYMAGGYNIQLFSSILNADLNDPVARKKTQQGDYDVPHTEQDYANIEDAITYKPEESWNYEFGTHLNLFNSMVHVDAAFFYTQLRNQQLSVMAPDYGFGRMTVNAGKSASCGAELSLRGSAIDNHLSWAATYSYTRSTFKEYTDYETTGNTTTLVDYSGNYVPYIPQHMFTAMADYRFHISNDGLLRAISTGVNVAGQGKTYWNDANTAYQKLYATLGGHVNCDLGAVNVNFWARNLTDTKYASFVLMDSNSSSVIGQRGLPLQLGVDVKMHF